MYQRSLRLPEPGTQTFFLWGPRQTGKTTLLKSTYPDAYWVDLLRSEDFRRYLQSPERLREELGSLRTRPAMVVIDEIQKVPALLDEVHLLMETEGLAFGLCGSSARKVRRGAANLLGGRAVRYELHGLVGRELGGDFDLTRLLNRGYLPRLFTAREPGALLRSYVADYLREEVAAEALVRNLPAFSEFLNVAALSDTQLVSFASIARECGVSGKTVRSYFEILEDTLLGRWLPGYTKRPKRRVIAAPKFYFSDVGIVNQLARRGPLQPRSELFGKAFENWVFHELVAANAYTETYAHLAYWRLASGIEVDFIVGDMGLAIEAKATTNVHESHLKGLRHLADEHPRVGQRVVVSLEPRSRRTDDGILVLPALEFCDRLDEMLAGLRP